MKKIVLILVLLITFYNLKAQEIRVEHLTADTLLTLFESGIPPFELLDRLFIIRNDIDYKGIYQEARLKPYIMRWLDRKEYGEYVLEKERIKFLRDTAWIKQRIKSKVKRMKVYQNIKISYDSIINSPRLFETYKDSVVIDIMKGETERYAQSPPYPDWDAISFHQNLAYPEAYEIIKKWWLDFGKKRNRFYDALVKMGDPEAKKVFDKYIEGFIKANGERYLLNGVLSEVNHLRSSHGIATRLKLLAVDREYQPFSHSGEVYKFNCLAIIDLRSLIFENNIPINPKVKYNADCEQLFANLDAVKESAKLLMKKYDEDNHYWMKNMPFYEEK